MKGGSFRLGTYVYLTGLGLTNPVDSRPQSERRVSESGFLVCICSCKHCSGHPQAAAPGGWFRVAYSRGKLWSHSNPDMGVPLGAVQLCTYGTIDIISVQHIAKVRCKNSKSKSVSPSVMYERPGCPPGGV